MKKIINGKKYDTTTAKRIGFYSNGYPYTDFRWCEETLYQKISGEYFIMGEGGAMSEYAKELFDKITHGSDIIPFDLEDAMHWCEKHLSVEMYEEIFGEVSE